MKKIISFAICILFTFPLLAQHGVNFRDLSYEQALEQAKQENKLLFIDCYTEWCGPCKKMMNEVFPQKAAGDFFNPRFVSVKFDMEKGEGKELSKKFDVHAYPTFLIVRTDGTVQHKLTGSSDLEGFIERVQKGLEEENTLPYQHQLYAKGEMSKQQLLAYKECLSEANDKEKAAQIYNELLEQLSDSDKMQKEFWGIYEDRSCQIGTLQLPVVKSNFYPGKCWSGKSRQLFIPQISKSSKRLYLRVPARKFPSCFRIKKTSLDFKYKSTGDIDRNGQSGNTSRSTKNRQDRQNNRGKCNQKRCQRNHPVCHGLPGDHVANERTRHNASRQTWYKIGQKNHSRNRK